MGRKLRASFFCLQDLADRSNLQTIFQTLTFQLTYQYPCFRTKLLQVLKVCPDVRQEALFADGETHCSSAQGCSIPTLVDIDIWGIDTTTLTFFGQNEPVKKVSCVECAAVLPLLRGVPNDMVRICLRQIRDVPEPGMWPPPINISDLDPYLDV